jgi:hypothetical protein
LHAANVRLSGLLKCSECGAVYTLAGPMHYACATFLDPLVIEEAKRRALVSARATEDSL